MMMGSTNEPTCLICFALFSGGVKWGQIKSQNEKKIRDAHSNSGLLFFGFSAPTPPSRSHFSPPAFVLSPAPCRWWRWSAGDREMSTCSEVNQRSGTLSAMKTNSQVLYISVKSSSTQ